MLHIKAVVVAVSVLGLGGLAALKTLSPSGGAPYSTMATNHHDLHPTIPPSGTIMAEDQSMSIETAPGELSDHMPVTGMDTLKITADNHGQPATIYYNHLNGDYDKIAAMQQDPTDWTVSILTTGQRIYILPERK